MKVAVVQFKASTKKENNLKKLLHTYQKLLQIMQRCVHFQNL
jgi:hypothetical protein